MRNRLPPLIDAPYTIPNLSLFPSSTSALMMPPTTIAAFLDDGFAMPAYSMSSSPSVPLDLSVPSSLFYPSIPSKSVSLSIGGVNPTTFCAADVVYAFDFVGHSSNGLMSNMHGLLDPFGPSLSGIQHHMYRAAIGDQTNVYSDIKVGVIDKGGVLGDAIARAQKLAGVVKVEAVVSAEPTLDDQLREVGKDVEKRVTDILERLSVGCRGRFSQAKLETAARNIVEYQMVLGIVDILAAGYAGKKVEKKEVSSSIESILGLKQDMSDVALAIKEEGATFIMAASDEKAALAFSSSKNAERPASAKGGKGGKGSLFPGSDNVSTHVQLTRWWTGSQDFATLNAIFTDKSSSPLETLSVMLRVYTESASWKKDYAVEIMSEALSHLVSGSHILDSDCILRAVRDQKRRLEDSGIPSVFEGLVRVCVLKGVVKVLYWSGEGDEWGSSMLKPLNKTSNNEYNRIRIMHSQISSCFSLPLPA
jgi:hypothetical protein